MRKKVVYYCLDCKRFVMEIEPNGKVPDKLRNAFDPPKLHEGHRLSRVP
ncbi:MAG: hypothetical protein QXO01_05960 [Nitrososphaerota archaeon]